MRSLLRSVTEVVGVAIEAVDIAINVRSDGSGDIQLTVHDERLEERIQLLRARGATHRDGTWHLHVDDVGEVADISGHLLGMIADMLTQRSNVGATRKQAIERDGNRCRICERDFDAPQTTHVAERVVDHVFPKHEAGQEHGVHETYNLVTVCRGCDDVFLQGDAFRFVPDRIDCVLTPVDRQLLAWIQKRAVVRSDWLTKRVSSARDGGVDHSLVRGRLRTFTGLCLLHQLPDIASNQDFDVFVVDLHHEAVGFTDKQAVRRHDRLPAAGDSHLDDDSVISMDERHNATRPKFRSVTTHAGTEEVKKK